MDLKEHTTPAKLEYYSFMWSEVRLAIAALALLVGGVPPIYLISPSGLFGLARMGLVIAWIISGLTAAYLLYRWYTGGQKLFGGQDSKDLAAFLVMVVSGINLGLTGLLGNNIGMSIASGRIVFFVVAILYIASAIYLYRRWNSYGKKMF